jgi:hypothetical protein
MEQAHVPDCEHALGIFGETQVHIVGISLLTPGGPGGTGSSELNVGVLRLLQVDTHAIYFARRISCGALTDKLLYCLQDNPPAVARCSIAKLTDIVS